MATLQKQLGQARPSDTNAASIYSPPARTFGIVRNVVICNNTGSAATYRIFHDADGTTYDQSTALAYDVSLSANTTTILEVYWPASQSAGNFAVRSGTGNALSFTFYGDEISGI